MTTVGIRQLRQNASAFLRRVEAGETIQIADRGRPVALWVPIARTEGVARLEAEGRLSPAKGDVCALGPPIEATRGAVRPGARLSRARRHER